MARRDTATRADAADVPPQADRAITRLTGPLLGVVRILIGYLWYTQTVWKRPTGFGCDPGKGVGDGNGGLCDWIGKEITYPKYNFYKTFLTDFVAPNLGALGWLIYLGELVTAVLLVLGLLTRLGGLLGFVQGLNLLIGLWAVPHEWFGTYAMLALINLTLALTAAGRWLGVDALLHPRAAAAAARGSRLGRLVALLT
jgi:thiosulfate dehydrogenase [quinone] large subunit